jgi:pimeloyl-ACP methyl ester carboxylesterase
MPVFVIWGDRDTITPLAQGERLAAITPKAELLVMKQVGHIPQIEDAGQFNQLLLKCVSTFRSAP